MSHDITLAEAADKAHQVELLMALLCRFPGSILQSEVQIIAQLAATLAGNVAYRLYEEVSEQESEDE